MNLARTLGVNTPTVMKSAMGHPFNVCVGLTFPRNLHQATPWFLPGSATHKNGSAINPETASLVDRVSYQGTPAVLSHWAQTG